MALGDNIVSICNIGLIALGEDLVVNVFPPDPNKRAILCAQRYDDTRRAVLRSYPWNCARKPAQLAASATPPPFGFANAYPLPPDCLQVLPLVDNAGHEIGERFEVMSGALYTNATSPINVYYTSDLQDPTKFDPLLVHALGYALAGELAVPIGQSIAKRDAMIKVAEGKMGAGRYVGSQEHSARGFDIDPMLESRR